MNEVANEDVADDEVCQLAYNGEHIFWRNQKGFKKYNILSPDLSTM